MSLEPRSANPGTVSWFVMATLLSSLALLAGCGGSKPSASEEAQPAASESAAAWKPTGEEGSITGKVAFKGQAPKFKAISMEADTVCAQKHSGPVMPEAVETHAAALEHPTKEFLGTRVLGLAEEDVWRSVLHDDAAVGEVDVIGDLAGKSHLVRDQQAGQPVCH